MRPTSFLRPHGEHIKPLSFISYRYHLFFIFLIVFLPCERIPFPVRTAEIPQGMHPISLYLSYFLTLLIEPHAADFLSPAAWGTHQTVIIHILQIPSIFHFPYCISTVRADSFPRSHGGNTTRYAPNFHYTYLIFLTLLIAPHAADFLSPAAWGTHQIANIHI